MLLLQSILNKQKELISIMPSILVQQCRKLTVLGYLVAQAIVGLAVQSSNVNFQIHIGLLIIATIAYIVLAVKDPGYVDYSSLKKEKIDRKINTQKKTQSELPQIKEGKDNVLVKDLSVIKEEKEQQIGELGLNSSIKVSDGVEKRISQHLNKQIPQLKIIQVDPCILQDQIKPSGFVHSPAALKAVYRYCRVCEGQQPLRVRHCLDCGKCVRTFDHHCPWINNCVGEKNKIYLIVYLFLQLTQLFGLAVDLILNIDREVTRQSITLWVAVTALGIALLGVLIFQIYLVTINLTTWECLRWYRIQYLLIFSKQKLRSLFSRGILQNISIFIIGGCSKQPVNWLNNLNPKALECLNTTKCTNTERRLNHDKQLS